jgi:Divergent InlB B-repeat domain
VGINGPGRVVSDNIDCDHDQGAGVAIVAQGSTVTLTAIPDGNAHVSGWDHPGCTSFTNTCRVQMDTDQTVIVSFLFPAAGPPPPVPGVRPR